jgi:hypothetical protein
MKFAFLWKSKQNPKNGFLAAVDQVLLNIVISSG